MAQLRYPRVVTTLDADAVRTAYRRWAVFYDAVFGTVSSIARHRAIDAVNALPGRRVLEMGVGTGLALPLYDRAKRVTGIDLSSDMLARAQDRVARQGLTHVEDLLELDAEDTGLPSASFDIAAAMFVASVVPNPRALLAEMRRVVRPGGVLLFINHFSALGGPRLAVERAMAPLALALGWHPDFPFSNLFEPGDLAGANLVPMPPFGLFTLVQITN
jgi:phosphatidylethanolamine/phosphatidyl-N-methylethanolamine N-methyltransferase